MVVILCVCVWFLKDVTQQNLNILQVQKETLPWLGLKQCDFRGKFSLIGSTELLLLRVWEMLEMSEVHLDISVFMWIRVCFGSEYLK